MNAFRETEVNAVMVVSTLVEVTDARAQGVSIHTLEDFAWVIMNLLEIKLTKCEWFLLKMVYHLPLL